MVMVSFSMRHNYFSSREKSLANERWCPRLLSNRIKHIRFSFCRCVGVLKYFILTSWHVHFTPYFFEFRPIALRGKSGAFFFSPFSFVLFHNNQNHRRCAGARDAGCRLWCWCPWWWLRWRVQFCCCSTQFSILCTFFKKKEKCNKHTNTKRKLAPSKRNGYCSIWCKANGCYVNTK